jgi:hypothetical protein
MKAYSLLTNEEKNHYLTCEMFMYNLIDNYKGPLFIDVKNVLGINKFYSWQYYNIGKYAHVKNLYIGRCYDERTPDLYKAFVICHKDENNEYVLPSKDILEYVSNDFAEYLEICRHLSFFKAS